MKIKVLGAGCAKCKELHKRVSELNDELNLGADVIMEEDIREVISSSAGMKNTPGLMINGRLKLTGKVPDKDKLKKYIKEEL